ncbi:MAG: IPT/TIG domain-containing protein, partial [Actinomycetia bacterium]|nr:IPT/TIG domain-containing protein [Actinomycetes bacterium]
QTTTPATATKVHIQDNYFDGFQKSTIWLYNAGVVTMERNTFGPNTFSNVNTVTEETVSVGTSGTGAGMIVNEAATSNKKILTWRPTLVSPSTGCEATVTAVSTAPVSPSTAPALPLRLDVFWTPTNKAEYYLTSQKVTAGTSATLTVTLPTEAFAPDGTLLGNIRLQTQALETAQTVSSQFSRVLPLTGTGDSSCAAGGIDSVPTVGGSMQGGDLLTLKGSGLSALASTGPVEVLLNGDALCEDVTVVDDETLTCVVPPSTRTGSKTGPVSVTVLVNGAEQAYFEDGYIYRAEGTLQVDKRAWIDVPDGPTGPDLYDALLAPGNGGAIELVNGAVIRPGETITWTYTVTYVFLNGGVPDGGASDVGLNQVAVIDEQLGLVCTVPVLYLNTPAGCVSGPEVTSL